MVSFKTKNCKKRKKEKEKNRKMDHTQPSDIIIEQEQSQITSISKLQLNVPTPPQTTVLRPINSHSELTPTPTPTMLDNLDLNKQPNDMMASASMISIESIS
eukprot:311008_1